MADTVQDEIELSSLFDPAQKLIIDIESGSISINQLQDRIKENVENLEKLTVLVSNMGLFSSNELIEDVPTDSLQFLMIPCFLGVFHENMNGEPEEKLQNLDKSVIYYRNYLERLRNLTLIQHRFAWDSDDDEEAGISLPKSKSLPPEEIRRRKLEQHARKNELLKKELEIKRQLEAVSIDDGILRDLYITQLKFWVERSFEELQSIEEELPLLKMMASRPRNSKPEPPKQPTRPPMKPFVITRDAQQKAVFGLGYPSIPTMTVDEWYHQKFGCHGGPAASQNQVIQGQGDQTSEHSDDEDDDEKRAKAMRWDEYKDDHRRGWGNTHNKG